ncbi:hypothetical protein [Pseudomonas aeruginosa]|uniref:hypothetical protein n=1 Tax=Pseudomonas aeruginosa TaxID=287 RepID=UPI00398239AA
MLAKLRRFNECAEDSDSGGVDIGRHWLDLLTQLGLLNRVQRSPALWEISQQGEDLLGLDVPEIEVPDSMIEKAWQRFERTLQQLETPGQAEQAEQAEAERPEGPTEDELEAAGLGYPLHKEEAVKLWYSGFRSEVITVLEAWEAIGHDTGINPDKEELLDSLRYMLEKCEAHDAALAEVERLRESKGDPSGSFDRCMKMMYERDENAKRLDAALARVAELEKGTVYVEARQCDECQHVGINDSADGLAACHDCDWTGPEPDEDKCPDCQRENCMAAACPQCGARYVLVASEEIAAPVAQAQHSVPEGFRELLEMLVASDLRKIRYAGAWRREVHDRASSILALLAAAPGKEVGHE